MPTNVNTALGSPNGTASTSPSASPPTSSTMQPASCHEEGSGSRPSTPTERGEQKGDAATTAVKVAVDSASSPQPGNEPQSHPAGERGEQKGDAATTAVEVAVDSASSPQPGKEPQSHPAGELGEQKGDAATTAVKVAVDSASSPQPGNESQSHPAGERGEQKGDAATTAVKVAVDSTSSPQPGNEPQSRPAGERGEQKGDAATTAVKVAVDSTSSPQPGKEPKFRLPRALSDVLPKWKVPTLGDQVDAILRRQKELGEQKGDAATTAVEVAVDSASSPQPGNEPQSHPAGEPVQQRGRPTARLSSCRCSTSSPSSVAVKTGASMPWMADLPPSVFRGPLKAEDVPRFSSSVVSSKAVKSLPQSSSPSALKVAPKKDDSLKGYYQEAKSPKTEKKPGHRAESGSRGEEPKKRVLCSDSIPAGGEQGNTSIPAESTGTAPSTSLAGSVEGADAATELSTQGACPSETGPKRKAGPPQSDTKAASAPSELAEGEPELKKKKTGSPKPSDAALGSSSPKECRPPSSSTDPKHIQSLLEKEGRMLLSMERDGNGFFRAISYSLFGHQGNHSPIRVLTIHFLEENEEAFKGAFADRADQHVEGTGASAMQISAASTLLQRDICVFSRMLATKKLQWIRYKPLFKSPWCRWATQQCMCCLTVYLADDGHFDCVAPLEGICNCNLKPPGEEGAQAEETPDQAST